MSTAPSVGGNRIQSKKKLRQSAILTLLGFPQKDYSQLSGNGKLQQYLNQLAATRGLPQPFNPSAINSLIQDVLPIAGIVGAGALPAEAGGETAAGGAGAGAGAGAAAKTAAQTATQTVGKDAALAALGGLATKLTGWGALRILKLVGGVILAYLGLRQLASAGTGGGVRRPSVPVPVPA